MSNNEPLWKLSSGIGSHDLLAALESIAGT
jgi:hypothetical protein